MQLSQLALTPTDLANYTYCPRLFQLSKIYPTKRSAPSFRTVWGLYEHEVYRLLPSRLDATWHRTSGPEAIMEASQADIDIALDYAYNLIVQNYPQYAEYVKTDTSQLRYRLNLWIRQQQRSLQRMMRNGFTFDFAISATLPWKVEDKLFSKKFGLHGRTDALYYDGQFLVPEDIKTHDGRFNAFLQHESHKAQLVCYSIMAEEQYSIPSKQSRVFFSRDLTYVSFKVTQTTKSKLETKINQSREQLSKDLPPVLQGPESIKCVHCYLRDVCFAIDKQQKTEDWLERLFAKPSNGELDLFGGDKNGKSDS